MTDPFDASVEQTPTIGPAELPVVSFVRDALRAGERAILVIGRDEPSARVPIAALTYRGSASVRTLAIVPPLPEPAELQEMIGAAADIAGARDLDPLAMAARLVFADPPPRIVLAIDQAHSLSLRSLSYLTVLTELLAPDAPVLQIVFAGGPSLLDKLAEPQFEGLWTRLHRLQWQPRDDRRDDASGAAGAAPPSPPPPVGNADPIAPVAARRKVGVEIRRRAVAASVAMASLAAIGFGYRALPGFTAALTVPGAPALSPTTGQGVPAGPEPSPSLAQAEPALAQAEPVPFAAAVDHGTPDETRAEASADAPEADPGTSIATLAGLATQEPAAVETDRADAGSSAAALAAAPARDAEATPLAAAPIAARATESAAEPPAAADAADRAGPAKDAAPLALDPVRDESTDGPRPERMASIETPKSDGRTGPIVGVLPPPRATSAPDGPAAKTKSAGPSSNGETGAGRAKAELARERKHARHGRPRPWAAVGAIFAPVLAMFDNHHPASRRRPQNPRGR